MNTTWDQLDNRGLSGRLWRKFAQDGVLVFKDPNWGFGVFDDFLMGTGPVATNVGGWNGYKTFEDTSTSCRTLASTTAALEGGMLKLLTDTTDNNSVSIAGGYGLGGPFRFGATSALTKELIFEARFSVSSVAATIQDTFVGLAGTGFAANDVPFADNDTVADIDFAGFRLVGHASAPHVDFIYKRTGQTSGTISNVVLTTTAAGTGVTAAAALAADTFLKVGFRLESNNNLSLYVNGAEVVASRINNATLYPSGTLLGTWPNLGMHLAAAVKNMTTTASYLTLDWWACAQAAGF